MNWGELRRRIAQHVEASVQRAIEEQARRLLGEARAVSSIHRPYRRHEQAALARYALDLLRRRSEFGHRMDESDRQYNLLKFYDTLAQLDNLPLVRSLITAYEIATVDPGVRIDLAVEPLMMAPPLLPALTRCPRCQEQAPVAEAVFCIICGAPLAAEGATIRLRSPQG